MQPAAPRASGGAIHDYLEPVTSNPDYTSPAELGAAAANHDYLEPVTANPDYTSPAELGAVTASRGRAHTMYACKYRRADGRPCRNDVAAGGGTQPYCRGHTCPAAGCAAPKRSSASHCPGHAPKPGAKKKTGKKPQRGKQASLYLGFNGTSGGGGGGDGRDGAGSTAV